jgi:hypothetical protein
MKGMILLITPSARIKECAATLQSGTGQPVDVAASLQEAGSRLRERRVRRGNRRPVSGGSRTR